MSSTSDDEDGNFTNNFEEDSDVPGDGVTNDPDNAGEHTNMDKSDKIGEHVAESSGEAAKSKPKPPPVAPKPTIKLGGAQSIDKDTDMAVDSIPSVEDQKSKKKTPPVPPPKPAPRYKSELAEGSEKVGENIPDIPTEMSPQNSEGTDSMADTSNFPSYVMVDIDDINQDEKVKINTEAGVQNVSNDDSLNKADTDTEDDEEFKDSYSYLPHNQGNANDNDNTESKSISDSVKSESGESYQHMSNPNIDPEIHSDLSLSFVVLGKDSVREGTFKSISSSISEDALENESIENVTGGPKFESKNVIDNNENKSANTAEVTDEKECRMEQLSKDDPNKEETQLSFKDRIKLFDKKENDKDMAADTRVCRRQSYAGKETSPDGDHFDKSSHRLSVGDKIEMFNVSHPGDRKDQDARKSENSQPSSGKTSIIGSESGQSEQPSGATPRDVSHKTRQAWAQTPVIQETIPSDDFDVEENDNANTMDVEQSSSSGEEEDQAASVQTQENSMEADHSYTENEKDQGASAQAQENKPPPLPPKSDWVYESMRSLGAEDMSMSTSSLPTEPQSYNYPSYPDMFTMAQQYDMAQQYTSYQYQQQQQQPQYFPSMPSYMFINGQWQPIYNPMQYGFSGAGPTYTQPPDSITVQARSGLESADPPTRQETVPQPSPVKTTPKHKLDTPAKETQRTSPATTKTTQSRKSTLTDEKPQQKGKKKPEQTSKPIGRKPAVTKPEPQPRHQPRSDKKRYPTIKKSPSSPSRPDSPSQFKSRKKESRVSMGTTPAGYLTAEMKKGSYQMTDI